MLNVAATRELVGQLRTTADMLERAAREDAALAECVVDFERGLCSLPELVASAKEMLDT